MHTKVLSERIGSGYGSGSQLLVATSVTFIFFAFGSSAEILMDPVAT